MNRDALDRAYERGENQIHQDHEAGRITEAEFRASLRDLARDYREQEAEAQAECLRDAGWR